MTLIGSVFRQFVPIPSLPSTASLKGQTVFVTGANTGLGLAAARQCVGLGAERVILAVRTMSNGEAAKASIQKSHPSSATEIDVWNLDLQSFDSVLSVGNRAAGLPRLDIALLNSGVFKFEWTTSSNGFETNLQVNHLATALLALTLIPTLKRTSKELGRPSRLTFTSAEAYTLTKFREQSAENSLDQLNKKEAYNGPIDRYCVSKLLNLFWARELASRTLSNDIIINVFNPGAVDTGYVCNIFPPPFRIFLSFIGYLVHTSPRHPILHLQTKSTSTQFIKKRKLTSTISRLQNPQRRQHPDPQIRPIHGPHGRPRRQPRPRRSHCQGPRKPRRIHERRQNHRVSYFATPSPYLGRQITTSVLY